MTEELKPIIEGSLDSKILFVSDYLRLNDKIEGQVFGGNVRQLFENSCLKESISSEDYAVVAAISDTPRAGKPKNFKQEDHDKWRHALYDVVKKSKANVIVPLGKYALEVLTGHKSIQKWHLSVTRTKPEFGSRKAIALFNPHDVYRDPGLNPYLYFGLAKIREHSEHTNLCIPDRKFFLNPSFDETMDYLDSLLRYADELSVDFETGRGQINTIGFAKSPREAIAIYTLPERCSAEKYKQLMNRIRILLESDIPKIAQQALYEQMWALLYGINIRNVTADTMWMMKFIYPELSMGLDNVGRIWTPFPYWKDDNESWNDIRDWKQHFDYNCKDTTGTFWAKNEMEAEIKDRGLWELWSNFVMEFYPVIVEMCSNGLLVNESALLTLRQDTERKLLAIDDEIQRIFLERIGKNVNLNSPKQKQEAFAEMGIKLPMVKDKKTGEMKPSTNKKAITKLKKQHPDEPIFDVLLKFSKENKLSSSYVHFGYDDDCHVRYALGGCNTETGRWNCKLDFRDNGFNAQTVPKKVRHIFQASPDTWLMQIDLSQAESRFVAWDAPETKLMDMINRREDIHTYVASNIFKKLPELISKKERQLGKKSGHAANYSVGLRTFVEACAVEMDIWLSEQEGRNILEGYHAVFPGIRKRQKRIQDEIRRHRMLKTPFGRERHFFGRMGDDTFREGYAYAPQSTIPDITNCLMLYLWRLREKFGLKFKFLLQVHDSLLLEVADDRDTIQEIIASARCTQLWHPKIELAGGTLVIPVDIEIGKNWGSLEAV